MPDAPTPESSLTRTQAAALARLRADGHLWPAGRGRWAIAYDHSFSDRTVQALVDAGFAEWAPKLPGVLPHVVPAGSTRRAPRTARGSIPAAAPRPQRTPVRARPVRVAGHRRRRPSS